MKKKASHLHLRLPAKLKKEAQQIIEASGLDTSSAIRLFFCHIVARRTIPLKFLTVNGLPREFEEHLRELAEDTENIVGPFHSADEAIAHVRSL